MGPDEEDDIVPTEVLTKLGNMRIDFAESSLQSLAIEAISANKTFYCSLATETNSNPFSSVPLVLRSKVATYVIKNGYGNENQEIGEDEEILFECRILQLLLNKMVTQFQFPDHYRHPKVTSIFSSLSETLNEECPHLQILVSGCKRGEKSECSLFMPIMESGMVHFADLQELRMCPTVFLKNSGLSKIASCLPKLRVLSTNLSKSADEVGIQYLSELKNLQVFTGFASSKRQELVKWTCDCLRKLHVVGMDFKEDTGWKFERSFMCGEIVQKLGGEFGLRRIALKHNIPRHLHLPNLESLLLSRPFKFEPNEQLSSLSELYLIALLFEHCIPLLSKVGSQLRTLIVAFGDFSDFDSVLQLCPNLEKLQIQKGTCIQSTHSQPFSVAHLKQLKIHDSKSEIFYNAPGLLIKLLQAHNLQYLEMHCERLHPSVVEHLNIGVRNGTIFENLETFIYSSSFDSDSQLSTSVVRNVAKFLPNVRCICKKIPGLL